MTPPDDMLAVRIVRLQAVVQGVVAGMMSGAGVFLATQWLLLKGGAPVGPNLALLAQFCPGFAVTMGGSLVGLGWGFAYGFAGGFLVSHVYNRIVGMRSAAADR